MPESHGDSRQHLSKAVGCCTTGSEGGREGTPFFPWERQRSATRQLPCELGLVPLAGGTLMAHERGLLPQRVRGGSLWLMSGFWGGWAGRRGRWPQVLIYGRNFTCNPILKSKLLETQIPLLVQSDPSPRPSVFPSFSSFFPSSHVAS